MRLRAFSLLLIMWASNAFAQPVIPFKSRELAEGKNYVQPLTAVLSVGEASGSLTYAFPIQLPPGRGLTPEISLQYSSQGRQSIYGWGWELTIPTIERSQRNGGYHLNSDVARDLYTFRNGHETRELAYLRERYGCHEYAERSQHSFNQYFHCDGDFTWHIRSPSGLKIELAQPREQIPYNNPGRISAWYASRILDPHGNYIEYQYEGAPPDGETVRIRMIAYTGHLQDTTISPQSRVTFNWAPHWGATRPVPRSYRYGTTTWYGYDKLDSIVVTSQPHPTLGPATLPSNTPSTRTYHFTYPAAGPAVSLDDIFYLISAQVESEPAVEFQYTRSWRQQHIDTQFRMASGDSDLPDHLTEIDTVRSDNNSTSLTKMTAADINSDGLLDLIENTSCDVYTVWVNKHSFFEKQTWATPHVAQAVGLPNKCALRVVEHVPGSSSITSQDFFDLDGDGYPDIVYTSPSSPNATVAYCRGNGAGFGPCVAYDNQSAWAGYLRREDTAVATAQVTTNDIIDMNGDGRPDLISAIAPSTLRVQLNNGSGFDAPIDSSLPSCGFGPYSACLRVSNSGSSSTRILVAETRDINGDGLPDFLKTDSSGAISVHWGLGAGFAESPTVLTSDYNGPPTLGAGVQGGSAYVATSDLVDVNGDGIVDAVSMTCTGTGQRTFTVRLNNGGVWDRSGWAYLVSATPSGPLFDQPCLTSQTTTTTGTTEITKTTSLFVDINGDGIPDFVSADLDQSPPVGGHALLVRALDYMPIRKLNTVLALNGNQGMSAIYSPQSGGQSPFPIHAPTMVVRARAQLYDAEPISLLGLVTTYQYPTVSYDHARRELIGFTSISVTNDTPGSNRITNFGETVFDAGVVYTNAVVNTSAQGAWDIRLYNYSFVLNPLNGESIWPRLDEEELAPDLSREIVTKYLSYNAYGNPTKYIKFGDVDADDAISHTFQYAVRDDATLLRVVLASETGEGTRGSLSIHNHYYDHWSTLGTITLGDETRTDIEIAAGTFAQRLRQFDGTTGEIVSETDEEGAETTYAYDTTYRQYPVVTHSLALGTSNFRSYHALTGSASDSCGPQHTGSGFGVTYPCYRTEIDSLGRATAEYVPTLNTGQTAYVLSKLRDISYSDSSYPLAMTVALRGGGHQIQYRDGFGNPVQLRVEETSGAYHVYETAFDPLGTPSRSELTHRENSASYSHMPISSEAWVYVYDYANRSLESRTAPRDEGDTSTPSARKHVVTADGVEITDEDGRQSFYRTDGFSRVTTIEQQGGAAGSAVTGLEYDELGDVTQVTDPNGLVTNIVRNLLGWTVRREAPDHGMMTYSYNRRGQVTNTTDARGVTVAYTYDPAGRPVRIESSSEPSGVRHVDASYSYYLDSPLTSKQFGWLQSETSDGITQTFTYNPESALSSRTVALNYNGQGVQKTVSMSYDTGVALKSVTYPDGYVANYSRFLNDSVRMISDTGGAILASVLYDDNGKPSVVSNDFGLEESFGYDARTRTTSAMSSNVQVNGQLVDDKVSWSQASYLSELNRSGLAPDLVPRTTPDVVTAFTDGFGRLTSTSLNGATSGTYTYDLGGRMTSFDDGVAGSNVATFSADKLVKRARGLETRLWNFDGSGNVVRDQLFNSTSLVRSTTHGWDALNRYCETTTSAGATKYFYSPAGDIVRVTGPGAAASLSDEISIGELSRYDLWSQQFRDRIVADGVLIGELRHLGATTTFEMVHHGFDGSVNSISDQNGNVIRQEEFRAYGTSMGNSGGLLEEHYQGLRHDQVTIAGRRAYDSDAGVWLGRDFSILNEPKGILEDARLSCLYCFDNGNPLSYRDPSGAQPDPVGNTDKGFVIDKSRDDWWVDQYHNVYYGRQPDGFAWGGDYSITDKFARDGVVGLLGWAKYLLTLKGDRAGLNDDRTAGLYSTGPDGPPVRGFNASSKYQSAAAVKDPQERDLYIALHVVHPENKVGPGHFPGATVDDIKDLIATVRGSGSRITAPNGNTAYTYRDLILIDNVKTASGSIAAGTLYPAPDINWEVQKWLKGNP